MSRSSEQSGYETFLILHVKLFDLACIIMEWQQGDRAEYYSYLEHQFTAIYNDSNDNSPLKPLTPDILNRPQILFMQFDMEKKGKKFGIAEWRLLKIEDGKLFQTSKGQQDKQIPFPIAINVTRKVDDTEEWVEREAQFEAKILLCFSERTDITVYFRSIIECNQIAMFLLAEMRKKENKGFSGLSQLYRSKLAAEVVKKIQITRQQSTSFQSAKVKAKILEHCRKNLNDRICLTKFLQSWRSKALFYKGKADFIFSLKQIDIKAESLTGLVKIWARGTVSKVVVISNINTDIVAKQGYKTLVLSEDYQERFEGIGGEEELQVECQLNGVVWKTERINVNDLRKLALKHRNLELSLVSKSGQGYLKISVNFQNSFPAQVQPSITPQHYRIIDELYKSDDENFPLFNIHQHYSRTLASQREKQHFLVSCSRVKQLMDLLKVEELIDKFCSVEPFNQYKAAPNRGTAIYKYFLRDYQNELYYEIEKLMWNHKQRTNKRLLTALKVFDQNLKFIFSDGFYQLVRSLHDVAMRESTTRWREGLFERSVQGIESIAFFLTIGFIKTFPSVLVHQEFVNKRALPYNSLLFIYAFRKLSSDIVIKLDRLQLNIQAFFGTHFVSLFSNLFEGDTLVRLLLAVLNEKREEGQSLILYSLIGVFMTVMEIIDGYSCSYASAEHYMLTFKETCRNLPNKFTFWDAASVWKARVKEIAGSKQFQQISTDMTDFYLSNAYSGQLGDVAQQIYQEFTSYHYKNQHELRKILLLVDRIDVAENVQTLTLSIFQTGAKLYEHEFKGAPLGQLGHFIEIRLIKLDQLAIICTCEKQSYLCRLDPKEVPSNLYFHLARPLLSVQRNTPEGNCHILFQVYIKDNCEIDALQNPLPTKYHQGVMTAGLAKEDLLFCRKYSKTFRMRENNFNLLYSKLGWFGCHYLVPDERLIGLQVLSFRNGGQQQLHSQISAINRYTRSVYGKALAPYPNNEHRHLSMQIIKEGIRTHYDPFPPSLKSSLSQASTYNSASRLATYALDNFHIACSANYLEFYYNMTKRLPLLGYLSYRPKQFYLLPTFTLQVATTASVCTVIISQKGLPFMLFSKDQALEIETKAQQYTRLPAEVEFGYTDANLYFDDFLGQLRLNILKRVITLNKKEAGKKGKRWGNSLVCISVPIPNYKLHHFFEAMNETKQIVQLEFRDKKTREGLAYDDFGLIGGLWVKVHCLAVVQIEKRTCFLVVQQIKRRTHLLRQEDTIKTSNRELKIVRTNDVTCSLQAIIDQFDSQ